jgi:tetratricopeptide (TPR) repeat protein
MARGGPTAGGRSRVPPGPRTNAAGDGFRALERGRLEEAEACFRRAVAEAPDRPEGYVGRGRVAEARGDGEAAVIHYGIVLSRWPERPESHEDLARMYLAQGYVINALGHLRRVAELRPADPEAHTALGAAYRALGALEPALACLDRALALDPDHLRAVAEKVAVLEGRGEHDAAWALLEPRIRGRATPPAIAYVYAGLSHRKGRTADAEALLEDLLAWGRTSAPNRFLLHHALAGLHARAGDPDRAFSHYAEVHRLRALAFDLDAHRAWVDRVLAAFDAARMARLPRASNLSRLPVFIVGMPRSGTTLTEQIVASHPEAAGAGELSDVMRMVDGLPRGLGASVPWPDCAADLDRATLDRLAETYLATLRGRFPDALRVTDKMPQNFLHLGLIALLFPGARVVHCIRDPVDTCLSCYFQYFGVGHAYAGDLRTLGLYYREYERLMAHWKSVLDLPILDLRYEDLVAHQEEKSRELIDFVGLKWDDRCLRFHETRRDVATASHDQVRRPIYTDSVERWKPYEKHLGPLLDALGR